MRLLDADELAAAVLTQAGLKIEADDPAMTDMLIQQAVLAAVFTNFQTALAQQHEKATADFQTALDSDFKCNTRVPGVGTDSRIKHLAFRSQEFFSAGGSTHLELCVSPDH